MVVNEHDNKSRQGAQVRPGQTPLARLHSAAARDAVVDAVLRMAETSGRDVLSADVLTQIIAALVAQLANARSMLIAGVSRQPPPTMIANGGGPTLCAAELAPHPDCEAGSS